MSRHAGTGHIQWVQQNESLGPSWAWIKLQTGCNLQCGCRGQPAPTRLGAFALVWNFPRNYCTPLSIFFFFLVTLWSHSLARVGMWFLVRDLLAMLPQNSQQDPLFSVFTCWWLVAKAQLVERALLNNTNLATAWTHTNYVSVTHLW